MNTPDPIPAPIEAPITETPPPPVPENNHSTLASMAVESTSLKAAVSGSLTDVMADWLIEQYATTVKEQLSATEDKAARWNVLRLTVKDVSALRRGDHSAGWLALQQAKFEEARRHAMEEQRLKDKPAPGCVTQETIEQIERELNLL